MKTTLPFKLTTRISREGNQYIARALPLDVVSSGKTPKEAKKALDEALELFLESAKDHGTLEFILRDLNKDLANQSLGKWINKILCGDCIELMNRMPESSIDLIVTSPPYNLKNSTGNGMKDGRGGKWASARLINGYATHSDDMPHKEYVAWQRDCLKAMMRVLAEDGAIFYNHKWRVQKGLLQDRQDIVGGFPVRQIIIWQRSGGINFNPGYFLPTYEVIYLICKPSFKLAPKASKIGDVWSIPQDCNNPHPASFPVELAQRCIRATNAKVVLDPFIGSGTTAIAAEAEGRNWIGIDVSEEYCVMALERIKAEKGLYRK